MAVIGIDFDHTLVNGDKAIEGAKDAINLLREHGHKIIIHSCNDPAWISRTLLNNDIRYDGIWVQPGKPICDLYVDDRGYRFLGDWKNESKIILDLVKGMDNRKW